MHFGLALPRQQVGCVGRKHVTNLGPIAMPISKIEYDFQNISDQLKSVPASFFGGITVNGINPNLGMQKNVILEGVTLPNIWVKPRIDG